MTCIEVKLQCLKMSARKMNNSGSQQKASRNAQFKSDAAGVHFSQDIAAGYPVRRMLNNGSEYIDCRKVNRLP